MTDHSPYTEHPNRLADVMSAIQLMGTFKYGSRTIANWKKSIGRDPVSSADWASIFDQHPEFFRVISGYASLVWRRAKTKNYHVERNTDLSKDEIGRLNETEKKKITRRPLDSSQVEALLNSAVQLHASALSHKKELRWWIPVAASLIGVLVGALISLTRT
ncbi:MAG: N-carbamoyl-L-amino acid amidohydrolase [Oceanospirillaceae bacterium]|nr:N-carbamoyl-L-amino acid amidohydrolase [Oceanospirillaceae bacterium]